jgi:hypothetical protein
MALVLFIMVVTTATTVQSAPYVLCSQTAINQFGSVTTNSPIQMIYITCASGCRSSASTPVYGTQIYGTSSSICRAAIHAGVIPDEWVETTIPILYGPMTQSSFTSSLSNGITSLSAGQASSSFAFIQTQNGTWGSCVCPSSSYNGFRSRTNSCQDPYGFNPNYCLLLPQPSTQEACICTQYQWSYSWNACFKDTESNTVGKEFAIPACQDAQGRSYSLAQCVQVLGNPSFSRSCVLMQANSGDHRSSILWFPLWMVVIVILSTYLTSW